MKRTGLKKWVMQKSRRIDAGMPSVSIVNGIVNVFDETMEPGARTASIFR